MKAERIGSPTGKMLRLLTMKKVKVGVTKKSYTMVIPCTREMVFKGLTGKPLACLAYILY